MGSDADFYSLAGTKKENDDQLEEMKIVGEDKEEEEAADDLGKSPSDAED